MSRTFASERARVLALALTALLLAALAFAAVSSRSNTLHTGAATAGVVHIEMMVKGQKTGVFKGDSLQKGHADQIVVSAFALDLVSPRDPATGQATGRRTYKPIMVTKEMDQSSPQFMNAAATNENLLTVVINFYETTRTGAEVNFYRVTLTDAHITEVSQHTAGSTVDEDVFFVFTKIEEDSLTGHTSFTDEFVTAG